MTFSTLIPELSFVTSRRQAQNWPAQEATESSINNWSLSIDRDTDNDIPLNTQAVHQNAYLCRINARVLMAAQLSLVELLLKTDPNY